MGFFTQFRQRQLDAANAAVTHHQSMLARFVDRLDAGPEPTPAERHVTVIARSPASPVVRALVARREALKVRGVVAQAILAHIEPRAALQELMDVLLALAPGRTPPELARWAANTCIHDAHEQLTLGPSMCWSGDMLRREPGKCDSLDLFEKDAPQTVRLGRLAFRAIWAVSASIPASRLLQGAAPQGAAYAHAAGNELSTPPFPRHDLRPPLRH